MSVGTEPQAQASPGANAPKAARSAAQAAPGLARQIMGRYGVPLILAVLVLGFSIAEPNTFATAGNARAIITGQAVLVILALAATLTLRAGDFDLSIAATMTLSGAVAARLIVEGLPLSVAIAAAVGTGLLVGLINGFLVVIVGVDSFVTTLASMIALRGLAYAVTESKVLSGFPELLTDFATYKIFGLPASVYYGWLLMLALWYVYERTPVGRYLLFIGGGREAARLAGIPVNRIRLLTFLMSSLLASFAGIVLMGSLGAVEPSLGNQFLLAPFAAAFLGATTIHVGRFNAVGTLLALYLVAVGITGLQLMGWSIWVSDVFNGLALVAAVVIARIGQRSLARKGTS